MAKVHDELAPSYTQKAKYSKEKMKIDLYNIKMFRFHLLVQTHLTPLAGWYHRELPKRLSRPNDNFFELILSVFLAGKI